MSTHATTIPAGLETTSPINALATRALTIGLVGIAVTALGLLVSEVHSIAMAWLVAIGFWTAIALGMIMMIMLHHVFDASWSVVIRRQWEHGLSSFKWLALLFLPLLIGTWMAPHDLVWPWMNPEHLIHGHEVGHDIVYLKKSAFLNINMFTGLTVLCFGLWIWLSARLRKASFAQDLDGDVKWTIKNRVTSAMGIPIVALALTAAAILWFKSLEYHWFSTMYGVWYFANCMRGALCVGVLMMVWLYNRGDYKGVLNNNHLHSIGMMMLTFTVFWAYISFSQYFLIWNANIPEETFWYNLREYGDWWWIGMVLVFGHFLVPFCFLLSYRYKVTHHIIRRIAYWILAVILIDMCYNILPAIKDAHGNPEPFFSLHLLWTVTAVIGVGGVCVWSYLKSFPTTKLIPIRDPRITECLTHHE